MNKTKQVFQKIKRDFTEIAYGISPFDRRIRKDALMVFIGMLIIFGTGGWLHRHHVQQQAQQTEQIQSFNSIKESPNAGLAHIDRLKEADGRFTVVLVGSKCKDCHRVAKPLTEQIKKAKRNGPVVVLDLDQFSDVQLKRLGAKLPSIKIDNSYYMPTVARYGHMGGKTQLIKISNSTKMQGLTPVFSAKPSYEDR